MNNLIANSYINSLGTLNATFPALLHTQMTLYSTGNNQGWWKLVILSQWFGPLHDGKLSKNVWSFRDSLLTLLYIFIFLVWLNLIYKIVLSLRTKYDDSRNRNNLVMEQFQSWVFIRSRITTLTFAWYFFRFYVTQFSTLFVSSLRIQYDNNKNKNNYATKTFQSWFWFDRKFMWIVGYCFFQTENTSKTNNIFWTYRTQFKLFADFLWESL